LVEMVAEPWKEIGAIVVLGKAFGLVAPSTSIVRLPSVTVTAEAVAAAVSTATIAASPASLLARCLRIRFTLPPLLD
jgi:hypothetical protein